MPVNLQPEVAWSICPKCHGQAFKAGRYLSDRGGQVIVTCNFLCSNANCGEGFSREYRPREPGEPIPDTSIDAPAVTPIVDLGHHWIRAGGDSLACEYCLCIKGNAGSFAICPKDPELRDHIEREAKDGIDVGLSVNPATLLHGMAKVVAAAEGLPVDDLAFQRLAAHLDEPVNASDEGLRLAGSGCVHPWKSIRLKMMSEKVKSSTGMEGLKASPVAECSVCGHVWFSGAALPIVWIKLHQRIDELCALVMMAEGVQGHLDAIDRKIAELAKNLGPR